MIRVSLDNPEMCYRIINARLLIVNYLDVSELKNPTMESECGSLTAKFP